MAELEAKRWCVFVCLACGWTDFAINCFLLRGSSFCKGSVFSHFLSAYHRVA